MPKPSPLALIAAVPPTAESERAPINWARARGAISAVTSRQRVERRPQESARDRRTTSELRRLARELADLEPPEVAAKLRALAEWYEGGAR